LRRIQNSESRIQKGRRWAFWILNSGFWILSLLLLPGCRSEPDSPGAQIRALIAKAEKAAEEKDASTLKDLISEKYQGKRKEKKRDLVAAVVYQLVRHQSIHLLIQVREIAFPEPSVAEATVFVAMAGRMIKGLGDLASVRADIYRVDFTAAEESKRDWKVTRVEWRPAELSDLEGSDEQ
jgi:hypothetical protein